MKKIYSLLSFIGTIILSASLMACHHNQPDSYDSQGNAIYLKQYLGKWVIINYWSTWCRPCLTEMPDLNRLYQQHKNEIMVLGVNYDAIKDKTINRLSKEYKINYPLLGSFPIKKLFHQTVSVLPISFVIDPQGKLVNTLKGPRTVEQLNQILKLSVVQPYAQKTRHSRHR